MSELVTKQQAKAILDALTETLEEGPWEETNFLRLMAKRLQSIRNELLHELGSSVVEEKQNVTHISRSLTDEQQEVFIGLYSSHGNNLQNWERILVNLPRQMISRPIYSEEAHIVHLIKSKPNPLNEAYVAVTIHRDDILDLPVDKRLTDKSGNPLMALKDRSIVIDNINRFVHQKETYFFVKGKLIKAPL